MTTTTRVSAAEQTRRAQQSEQAQQAQDTPQATPTPQSPEDAALAQLADEYGITPAEAAAASRQRVEVVNLDEMTTTFITLKFREWVSEPLKLPDGTERVRNRPAIRDVELAADPTTEDQLAAMRLLKEIRRGTPDPANPDQPKPLDSETIQHRTAECVLRIWRQTEPDMTLDRLQRGLDVERIARLFNLFFDKTLR